MLSLWGEAEYVAASRLGYAESVAALRRKRIEEPSSVEPVRIALPRFEDEWPTILIVELGQELEPLVRRLADRHSLRGADLVHLASCLLPRNHTDDPVTFACWDAALLDTARLEGLRTLP